MFLTPVRPCPNHGALTETVRNTIARQRLSRRFGREAFEHLPKQQTSLGLRLALSLTSREAAAAKKETSGPMNLTAGTHFHRCLQPPQITRIPPMTQYPHVTAAIKGRAADTRGRDKICDLPLNAPVKSCLIKKSSSYSPIPVYSLSVRGP